jgi:predicted amidohydrolase
VNYFHGRYKKKIGIAQFSPVWENKEKNIDIINKMTESSNAKFDMLLFPEMTLTGFTMNSEANAEEIDGVGFRYFMGLAYRLKTDIIAGVIERDGNEIYNSLIHIDSQGLIKAVYRKIHPFSLANENLHFSGGKDIVSTNFKLHPIGLSVCYDLRFPELYRLYGKQGAEIMINIANWPEKRIMHWNHLLNSRAIENQCFMVGVNRIGNDPYQEYPGRSAVYDPIGRELFAAGKEQGIFEVNIDFENLKSVRESLGFLEDIKLI